MGNITEIDTPSKYKRDYVARHKRIRDKLREMAEECHCGCFQVSKIATQLRMDQRTVRAHLKIVEANNSGAFVDPEEKEFCTKEGIILLAGKIGLKKMLNEQ